jgi:hypothetical protein
MKRRDRWAYRYRVETAHGCPPADYKAEREVILPDDKGNVHIAYDVKAGRAAWLAVLVFTGCVPRSELPKDA